MRFAALFCKIHRQNCQKQACIFVYISKKCNQLYKDLQKALKYTALCDTITISILEKENSYEKNYCPSAGVCIYAFYGKL